jgi:hypothetical protein
MNDPSSLPQNSIHSPTSIRQPSISEPSYH